MPQLRLIVGQKNTRSPRRRLDEALEGMAEAREEVAEVIAAFDREAVTWLSGFPAPWHPSRL